MYHKVSKATALLVFLAALSPRLAYVFLIEAEIPQFDDPWYFLSIAENILSGEGFREGNLFAYRPPLYPYFIASLLLVFGGQLEAVFIVQAIIASIMCVLIYIIGAKSVSHRTGIIASILCAIYPHLIHYAGQLWSEQLFAFLAVLSFYLFIVSRNRDSIPLMVLMGVVLGFSILCREAGILLLIAYVVWILFSRNVSRSLVRRLLPLVLATCLTVLPWTVRNYLVFGTLVPVSTNGGINFYIGNNPEAIGAFNWVIPPEAHWNELSPDGRFEVEASRLGYIHGLRYIVNNPVKSFHLVSKRAYYLLRPPFFSIDFKEIGIETLFKLIWSVMYCLLLLVLLVAVPFRYAANKWIISLLIIVIVALSIPYLLTYGATRYRVPMMPFMILIAAIVLNDLVNYIQQRRSS
jgi:4-amino-4-deoxy-L-arabinose transferase-like glycosyltransferase